MQGQISDNEAVVYFVDAKGELMLAPDTRMRPFRGWRRVECKTRTDIENFSRRMAAQQYQRFRSMKIEEHMRSQRKRDELKANCRLRLAAGCISQEDERLTRQTLHSLERKDAIFYDMLAREPDLTKGALLIEKYDSGKIEQMGTGKRRGLADHEINAVSQLAETTA
jgi:hypothetical protein